MSPLLRDEASSSRNTVFADKSLKDDCCNGSKGGLVSMLRTKARSHLGTTTKERGRSVLKDFMSCVKWYDSVELRPSTRHTELIADL